MSGEKRKINDLEEAMIGTVEYGGDKKVKVAEPAVEAEVEDTTDLEKLIQRGDKEQVDKVFKKYLEQYVNDGDAWTMYIRWMIENRDKYEKKEIESCFFKVLTKIYHIELWRLYLKYIEMNNVITPDDSERARSVVLKAYTFAIDTVGIDYFEGDKIWADYLKYLSEWQAVNPNEVETRESMIRKALRTMITYPSKKLSDHWKAFTHFESSIDMTKSRKIMTDASAEIVKVRKLNDELEKITGSIVKMNPGEYSQRQISKWKRWIEWEEKNPMELSTEEVSTRVRYVYNLSIQYGRFMPQVWMNYATYLLENGKKLESVNALKDGLSANRSSFILTNALSNVYEMEGGEGNVEDVKKLWFEMIDYVIAKELGSTNTIVSFCYCEVMKVMNRIAGLKEVRGIFRRARQYKNVEWNVYYEYSMIEYHNGETTIASRSFSLGMQHFKSKIQFVLKYLDFLVRVKDMVTFKNVVERSIEHFKEIKDKGALKRVFCKYYEIETQFGDAKLINKLYKRYDENFGEMKHLDLVANTMEEFEHGFNAIKELDEYKGKKEFRAGGEEDDEYSPEAVDTTGSEGNRVADALKGLVKALQQEKTASEASNAGISMEELLRVLENQK